MLLRTSQRGEVDQERLTSIDRSICCAMPACRSCSSARAQAMRLRPDRCAWGRLRKLGNAWASPTRIGASTWRLADDLADTS
jgi:hypothetical protein